jgi:23S rRNA (cytidine1920-2'-O)/16S rRNA (cytidine1409-2'-O)-methyltransferase
VLSAFLTPEADIVALVKPQFEAGRHDVGKGGVITDPAIHEAVIEKVTGEAQAAGLRRIAMTPSPITGATGNREFFLHLKRAESNGL